MHEKASGTAAKWRAVMWPLLIFLLMPSLLALRLEGMLLSPIAFEPGKVLSNHYVVREAEHPLEISVGGDFAEYISLSPLEYSEPGTAEFDLVIAFPDFFPQPGEYSFSMYVTEKADAATAQVGSLLSVGRRFEVEVYSFDKALEAALSAPDVNEGTPAQLNLGVQSRGYRDIEAVSGIITLYSPQNSVLGSRETETRPLPALAAETFMVTFPTDGLPAGEYSAKATVTYDGQQLETDTKFRIGQMDLILLGYNQSLPRGFSRFVVQLANNWGEELYNVYARLFLSGEELLQTPSITLPPWGEGLLQGIVNIPLAPGRYDGVLQLFFEGEQKEVPITLEVTENVAGGSVAEELQLELRNSRRSMLLFGLTVGFLLIVILALLVVRLRGESDDGF